MSRLAIGIGVLLLASSALLAQPAVRKPVREGDTERLILDDGTQSDAAAWTVVEATVTADRNHARHGDSALRFHVDVNWETGEKEYPIGWPRMNRNWPETVRNWSGYDYLEFSVFVQSSRKTLPRTPLSMSLYGPSDKTAFSRVLGELQLGQWTNYRIPIADLPKVCNGIQFFISESDYKHLDMLDFWIDNISLVRYTAPTMSDVRLLEQAITADSRYVKLQLAMLGMKPDAKAEVTWQIGNKGRQVATGKFTVTSGRQTISLLLPAKPLPAGDYDIVLKSNNGNRAALQLLITTSPWQEGAK